MSLDDWIYKKEVLGKNGVRFTQYKIKTMYDSSKYDLERLAVQNGLDEIGKIVEDPRVISSRKWLRKYWIDELPQIYNIFRGEMSIVGSRPRSDIEWARHDTSLKNRVLQFSPGLFGVPYYKKTKDLNDVVATENLYLSRKEKHPVLTDIRYFFRILFNIIFLGYRSR